MFDPAVNGWPSKRQHLAVRKHIEATLWNLLEGTSIVAGFADMGSFCVASSDITRLAALPPRAAGRTKREEILINEQGVSSNVCPLK